MKFFKHLLPHTALGFILFAALFVMQPQPAQASDNYVGLQTGLSLNSVSSNLSLEGGMNIDDTFAATARILLRFRSIDFPFTN